MSEKLFRKDGHFVVAIGASAGGLEAIHEFFDHMPDSGNISFVIVQHLSPDYKSLLVELVSRHTHMKVFEAEHNLLIQRNCIYVIPNNKLITLRHNRLILSEKLTANVPNTAIDTFIYTLATEKKHEAIAVILSGTGTDGTRGIAKIKEEGGLVIVQEPSSSKFNGMPNSAIASGYVDFILPPDQIPSQIVRYIEEAESPADDVISDEILQRIFARIHHAADIDFHFYKTPTIVRRIFHRMRKGNFDTVGRYLEFLEEDPDEARQLGKEFLINVTRFFRDSEAYEMLKHRVFPAILQAKAPGEEIKLWVCACSTGEEAYSLAIVLDEVLREQNAEGCPFKIFATDIDRTNIDIASKGFYPRVVADDVGMNRLNTYFIAHKNGFLINPRIRKHIVFAVHNVINNPPFIKNDLVSCRNMLIYMNPALQERVYSVLLFSVKKGGYIFLGATENPNPVQDHLDEVSSKYKIYLKRSEGRKEPYIAEVSRATEARIPPSSGKGKTGLLEELKDSLLMDLNLAAFYIDSNFEIRDAVGNFDQILSLPKKILKLNLLRMLPAGISSQLALEIKSAWRTREKKIVSNLTLHQGEFDFLLQVLIKPDMRRDDRHLTVVIFQYAKLQPGDGITPVVMKGQAETNDYVLSLEEELNDTRTNLQHAIEDLEMANEELQSTNEELLSSNEELQSSNEELQSLNEELHTLNTEHQIKIRELIELNDDLNNYFRSSNVGQIFLDQHLGIRKFTPASTQLINVIQSDIGRPITHISTNIKYRNFIQDIGTVLRTRETIEKEVELNSGMNVLLRIMPYLTGENKNGGVIISFFDISTVTSLNNIIRGVFNSSQNSIFALQAVRDVHGSIVDFMVLTSNRTANRLVGTDSDNITGSLVTKSAKANFLHRMFDHFVKVVDRDAIMHMDFYYETEKMWLEASAVKMMDGLVVTLTDITQKKNSEERLKRNYAELIRTKEHLKQLNTQLELKVTERTQMLSASEERFRLVARATNDAIWDWDLVNNRIWFSEAFFRKFGYDTHELFSRKSLLSNIHPDESRETEESILRAIDSNEKQWTREYRFRKKNGEYANILDRGYIMQDDSRIPYRMVGSMLDLTELKRAQEQIAHNVAQRKFLAESMPLIVWTADANGKVDFVNNQFRIYTGISHEDALGDGWLMAVHPDDLPGLRTRWTEAIEYRSNFQTEIRLRVFDATYHWNILRAKVLIDDSDKRVNWVVTTIDIHEQKLYHELLEQKVDERTQELLRINHALEVSNHDLQQFASVASHDLQEPLRKIHLYASLIHDRFSDTVGTASSYLQKILQSSVRMKAIINNILKYSKLSADHVGFEQTDLNRIISEIIEDLEIAIHEKKATIHVSRLPVVQTIPGQIRHVFQNMIGNALKFSRPSVAPEISVAGETVSAKSFDSARDPAGRFLKITIADNGIGFNEKFAQQVFVLFQRLHSKDAFEGTGIGLAIAKKIIEKHHGIIKAHGKEGEGAVFDIIIPLQQSIK